MTTKPRKLITLYAQVLHDNSEQHLLVTEPCDTSNPYGDVRQGFIVRSNGGAGLVHHIILRENDVGFPIEVDEKRTVHFKDNDYLDACDSVYERARPRDHRCDGKQVFAPELESLIDYVLSQ